MKYYTKEWHKNGCKCTDNQDEYWQLLDTCKGKLPKWYDDKFSLHDNKIVSVDYQKSADGKQILTLNMDYSGGFDTVGALKFENCTILENAPLENSWCIADEMYLQDNGMIEFHLLLQNFQQKSDDNLFYFTVLCEKIDCAKGEYITDKDTQHMPPILSQEYMVGRWGNPDTVEETDEAVEFYYNNAKKKLFFSKTKDSKLYAMELFDDVIYLGNKVIGMSKSDIVNLLTQNDYDYQINDNSICSKKCNAEFIFKSGVVNSIKIYLTQGDGSLS